MFLRRIYYNTLSGEILLNYSMNGDLMIVDTTKDIQFHRLNEYVLIEDIGVFEWLEPDEEIESKFNGGYSISIDVSTTPHQIIFTEIPEPEPIPEDEQPASQEDYETALEELGVINNDN